MFSLLLATEVKTFSRTLFLKAPSGVDRGSNRRLDKAKIRNPTVKCTPTYRDDARKVRAKRNVHRMSSEFRMYVRDEKVFLSKFGKCVRWAVVYTYYYYKVSG